MEDMKNLGDRLRFLPKLQQLKLDLFDNNNLGENSDNIKYLS